MDATIYGAQEMINPAQLKAYVILPVLEHLNPEIPVTRAAVDLMLGTAAQESRCGTFLHQLGNGPAVGVWQMEPNTAKDHLVWLEARSRGLLAKVLDLTCRNFSDLTSMMEGNLYFACAMARVHYWRCPGPIPNDLLGQAKYWKQFYNTTLGAGTVDEYLDNWRKL